MAHLIIWTVSLSLVFVGVDMYSSSMSCSMVDGKQICTREEGNGNFAGSSANAGRGQDGSYQNSQSMIANSQTGDQSSSRMSAGQQPGPGDMPGFMPGNMFGGGAFNPFAFVFGPGFGRRR